MTQGTDATGVNMNLSAMRAEYGKQPLRREDLCSDPIEQFGLWLAQACEANLCEPNAMSLATLAVNGGVSIRTVLLKHFDQAGFVFFTNLESRKAREILANPNVALLFPWIEIQRQVSVRGTARRLSTAEVLAYFVSRPFQSQIAAWASPQSRPIATRALLESKWNEMKTKFQDGKVPLPSFWGGYRVQPYEIEFWQGRENRLHDRFLYTLEDDHRWRIDRLAP